MLKNRVGNICRLFKCGVIIDDDVVVVVIVDIERQEAILLLFRRIVGCNAVLVRKHGKGCMNGCHSLTLNLLG